MAPGALLVQGLRLPVAAPATSRAASLRRAHCGVRVVSSNQWMAESKCTDVTETSRDRVAVLASRLIVAGACVAAFACSAPLLGEAYAAEGVTEDSNAIFQRSCAGCHAGGGNILQPNATLFAKDLDRNGMGNVDDVFQITYFGKGRMPGYDILFHLLDFGRSIAQGFPHRVAVPDIDAKRHRTNNGMEWDRKTMVF